MGITLSRRFIRRAELHSVTGIKMRAWDAWHRRGIGPRRIKAGKAVLYDLTDVLSFLESQKETARSAATRRAGGEEKN